MPGIWGETMRLSPLPCTSHLRQTGGQEAPWISTGRWARRQGEPSPSLRALCGKQWNQAKGRERLPGRKHLAVRLSQRTGSSFQLQGGRHPPCCLAPRFLHHLPLVPRLLSHSLMALRANCLSSHQSSHLTHQWSGSIHRPRLCLEYWAAPSSLSASKAPLTKIVPLLLCSSPSGNYCFDVRVVFWHHALNIQALFCNH